MNDDRDEAGAREIAHAEYGTECRDPHVPGTRFLPIHGNNCNALTAAIMSYGDARAAGERERCAKVAISHASTRIDADIIALAIREAGD